MRQFGGPELLAQTAASDWLREICGIKPKGARVSTALSGGRIARDFFAALAQEVKARQVSLEGVHFFWSDERCVGPTDPESNFRLANDLLFMPLKLPALQIHRLKGELEPRQAAVAAEADLRQFTACPPPRFPEIDLVLLGMGEDGHVASLFPGESEEAIASPAVFRHVTAAKPPPLRLTLGYSTLAAAREVWVLASGKGKKQAFAIR